MTDRLPQKSMKSLLTSPPAQSRQTKERFAKPEDYLSYELGKAVKELPPLYTRLLAGSVSLLVFGAIAWAHFSTVDEVAVATGELIPSVQVRPVRSLAGGMIRSVKVKEGDRVKQGDSLIELDAALPQTEIDRLNKSAKLIRLDIARLEAERKERLTVGGLKDQLLAARLREFDSLQAAATAEANRQSAAVSGAKIRFARLQENLSNAKKNLANARKKEQGLRTLIKDGAITRLNYIDAQDNVISLEDKVNSLEKDIAAQEQEVRQTKQAYLSAQKSADRMGSARQSETLTQLDDRSKDRGGILTQINQRSEELTTIEGQLKQARQERERETIKAPVTGTIYNVKITTAEGTVQPDKELLSVLPEEQELLLEVKVLNRDIGFISPGMKAKVKMATFPFQEFGTLEGTVVQVSPNAITEKDLGLVFPTRIRLNKDSVRVRGQDVKLVPGMAASGEIITRKKSILTFLIEPITHRFSEAFSVR